MPFRAVADTDRAEMLLETIFPWQYSPLQIHLAHKIGYQSGGACSKETWSGRHHQNTSVFKVQWCRMFLTWPTVEITRSSDSRTVFFPPFIISLGTSLSAICTRHYNHEIISHVRYQISALPSAACICMGQVILWPLWLYFCNRANKATPHHTGVICLGMLSVILIRSNVILVASDLCCQRWHLITRALWRVCFLPLQPPSSALFVIFAVSGASVLVWLQINCVCSCKLHL